MSSMGHSNRAHRIQQLAESPFTLLAKAAIPYAVTSASALLHAIQGFWAYQAMPETKARRAITGTTGPPVMDIQLVFNQWHFSPTWNGCHLDDIIPHQDFLASRIEHALTVATTPSPAPLPIDIPATTVDPPIPPILNEGRATSPTVSPTFESLIPASFLPTSLWITFVLCLPHVAPIKSQVFHLYSPGCRGNRVPPDKPNILFSL